MGNINKSTKVHKKVEMQIFYGDNILIILNISAGLLVCTSKKRGHQNWNCRTLQGPCSATRLWKVDIISRVHPKHISIKHMFCWKVMYDRIDISFVLFLIDLENSFCSAFRRTWDSFKPWYSGLILNQAFLCLSTNVTFVWFIFAFNKLFQNYF